MQWRASREKGKGVLSNNGPIYAEQQSGHIVKFATNKGVNSSTQAESVLVVLRCGVGGDQLYSRSLPAHHQSSGCQGELRSLLYNREHSQAGGREMEGTNSTQILKATLYLHRVSFDNITQGQFQVIQESRHR